MLVERAAPYKVFKIYDGLSHWCPCGANDMDTRTLIGHVKDHHHGIILKNTQLNRPHGSTGLDIMMMNWKKSSVLEKILDK